VKCTPLAAPFGARLHIAPGTPVDGGELRALFREHELLLIRGQEISAAQQREILSHLGRIEPNPDGTPMEMEVTNQHDQTTAPEGELIFHYDYAYDPAPITAISMYGLLVAEDVTPTLFASSSRVLERLPDALRERLRGIEAAHACFLTPWGGKGERAVMPDPLIPRAEPGWGPDHYWAHHPAIWHNEAGVESLFLCIQHTDCLLGMPRDESDALLETLYGYLYDPAHVYEHRWEPHDMVIWDNITVQHARPEPRPAPRTLRRYHVSPTDLTDDYVRVARELEIM
jgi:taurine dioxygenase